MNTPTGARTEIPAPKQRKDFDPCHSRGRSLFATQWHFVAGAGLEPASSGFQSFVRRLVVAAEYSKVLASLRWCAFQRLAFRRFASVTRNAVTRHHDLSQAA